MANILIYAYVGSVRNNSATLNYVKDFVKMLNENDKRHKYSLEIVTPDIKKIDLCIGCQECFGTGSCIIKSDDLPSIVNSIQKANLFLFASPTYMHHVSHQTKNFIDRLAYTSHSLKFLGIPTVVLSTTDYTGGNLTASYLEKISTALGCNVLSKVSLQKYCDIDQGMLNEAANDVINYFSDKRDFYISDNLIRYYEYLKKNVEKMENDRYEYMEFERNECFKHENLRELIKNTRKKEDI